MKLIFNGVILATMTLNSCESPNEVVIGKQVWMTENLNVDTFRNGDSIKIVKTKEEWLFAAKNKQPACCFYKNHKIQDDPNNGEKYGKLYNWYAVNDKRGLSPLGWHIPCDDEWTMLTNQLGGRAMAEEKLKSTNSWEDFSGSGNGTNSSKFNALPGGLRKFNGEFGYIYQVGLWWSSSIDNPYGIGLLIQVSGRPIMPSGKLNNADSLYDFKINGGGMYVRCIKD